MKALQTSVISAFGLPKSGNLEPLYGIELEYEKWDGRRLTLPSKWRVTADNSLRAGIEVLSPPLSSKKMLEDLTETLASVKKAKLTTTKRCGLHVHINMRPHTVGQLFSFITMYALAEPSIFATYAEGRDDSNFCVPMFDQDVQVNVIANALQGIRDTNKGNDAYHITMTNKYSALNFTRMRDLGTVEMRQPYCTLQPAPIKNWIRFNALLRRLGTSYNDPIEVIDWYRKVGKKGMQKALFGQSVPVIARKQELAEDAAFFMAGHKPVDWKELEWDKPALKPKPKPRAQPQPAPQRVRIARPRQPRGF